MIHGAPIQNVNDYNWFGIMDISVCLDGGLIDKMTLKGQNLAAGSISWWGRVLLMLSRLTAVQWSEVKQGQTVRLMSYSNAHWARQRGLFSFAQPAMLISPSVTLTYVLSRSDCVVLYRGNIFTSLEDPCSTKISHLLLYTSLGKSYITLEKACGSREVEWSGSSF